MKFLFLSFALLISEVAFGMSTQSRVVAAAADMHGGLKTALDRFEIDCGHYPTTSEGLAALINCPTNISNGRWRGPYMDEVPIDPWGNDYVYRCPGIHNTNGYDLYSCGFDGISKSGGDDLDDINNWDKFSPHGGYDRDLNLGQWLVEKLGSSAVAPVFFLILPLIPFFGAARLIAAIFSQRVRDSIARRPILHIIWLLVSLVVIFIIFESLIPRIA